jgi:threonine/homoserine/homoserine lactone efflux protein
MDALIEIITSTHFIVLVAAVVAGLLVYSLLKQLFRMALILLALAAIYTAYLVYTGQELPRSQQEILHHVQEQSKKLQEELGDQVIRKGPQLMEEMNKKKETDQ